MRRAAICLAFVTACASKPEPPAAEHAVPRDAGEAVHEVAPVDPLDEAPIGAPGRAPGRPAAPRGGHPIDVILRSSPSGATVAVDGVQVGTTPAYWAGEANGRDHEFLFVRKGYAYARYRFVPITSGVVHARLEPVAEDSDAGVPPEVIRMPEPPLPMPAMRPPAALDAAPGAADTLATPDPPSTGAGPQP